MPLRKPTSEELKFIAFMITQSKSEKAVPLPETLMVGPMDDQGMGGLVLYPHGEIRQDRNFGSTLFEIEFKDADQIPVVAALNIDQHGDLFELDIWKVTFDPLIRFPDL